MATQNPWINFAVQVAIGTIAGGFSDTVAVWMLFRPRQRRLGFQGAIPKNQPRLAKSIGRTVGERLLTPHDLMEEIARSGLRDALERQLAVLLTDALDNEHGSLATIIPSELLPAVEQGMQDFLTRFVNDLPFRERMVARLVLTDRTVEKIVEALEQPIGRPGRWLPPDTARAPRPRRSHPRSGPGSSSISRRWSSDSACRRWSSARCWPSVTTALRS